MAGKMTLRWVLPTLIALLVVGISLPAQACIPGMPEQEFVPQTMGTGSVFLGVNQITNSTVDELFPFTTAFKDKLYVIWQREEFNETVKYYVTLTSFDGTSWSKPIYLSSPDINEMIRSELNLNPRMCADDEGLYVVWTSDELGWTHGTDDDVVFRYTQDGETWSDVIEVTGTHNDGLDKLPRAVPFKDDVWFVWETNDDVDAAGTDFDIVMRSWDGTGLGQVLEVTDPGDEGNDHYCVAVADEDYMYIGWMMRNQTSGFANVYDVWGRVFDGTRWVSPPTKLSSDVPKGNGHPAVVAGDGVGFFLWETEDTGSRADPSSVALRAWTPELGFRPLQTVSSLTSNGFDTKPAGLWWNEQLYVAWASSDPGVTFGEDQDLLYRTGTIEEDGLVRFGDFIEVSEPTDDYTDQFPSLVVYDEIVNAVWIVDTNFTEYLPEEVLNTTGGFFRSPDVAIQSIDIPFHKSLKLTYSLGTAIPTAGKLTSAGVTITDLDDRPMMGLHSVGLEYVCLRDDPSTARTRLMGELEDPGGTYGIDELEFPHGGTYRLSIIIDERVIGSFLVDVQAPPPSFLDRVPFTSMVFLALGVVSGGMMYRSMGRDELVSELRPAPLEGS